MQCKISDFWLPNLYFDRLLLLKVYVSAKKGMEEIYLMIPESGAKFEENLIFYFRNDKNLLNFGPSTKKSKKFDWSLLCKVYNVWPKKVLRSYISWHWRVMQNLKKNWLVVWKMTWGIWQIFTRAHKILKIGTFIGSFYTK